MDGEACRVRCKASYDRPGCRVTQRTRDPAGLPSHGQTPSRTECIRVTPSKTRKAVPASVRVCTVPPSGQRAACSPEASTERIGRAHPPQRRMMSHIARLIRNVSHENKQRTVQPTTARFGEGEQQMVTVGLWIHSAELATSQ